MHSAGGTDLTQLLEAVRGGDDDAREQLYEAVYPELRRIARQRLARQPRGHTLQTTALVHEVYCRLAGREPSLEDSRHLLAVAATAMRQILVDHARRKGALKRGDGARDLSLDDDGFPTRDDSDVAALLRLDRALGELEAVDARLARVVELRFFGGLSVREVAETLKTSEPTVVRDSRAARAFLIRQLEA